MMLNESEDETGHTLRSGIQKNKKPSRNDWAFA